VFEENKLCLLRMSGGVAGGGVSVIATTVNQQCPTIQPPGPTRPFCMWDISLLVVTSVSV